MTRHSKEYSRLFDYLRAEDPADHKTGLVVFGRKDPLVAHKVVDLAQQDKVSWAIVTGGVGKDSGDLKTPESEYLAEQLRSRASEKEVTLPPFYLETQASNGAENVGNSLIVMRRAKLSPEIGLTAVAHATSSRRLGEMLRHKVSDHNVYRAPTDYPFDPANPADQKEARDEFNRLLTWPEKGWLPAQDDLPEDLVDFVVDINKKN